MTITTIHISKKVIKKTKINPIHKKIYTTPLNHTLQFIKTK